MDIAKNGAVAERRPARLPRQAAFWALFVALVGFLAAAGAPSPLYVVYQQRFKFSTITLTVIFAVYIFVLLLALVTVGALSDYIGRRPVLAACLLLAAVGAVVFLAAGGVGALLLARALLGIATGAVSGAIGAALVDTAPPDRPRRAAVVNSIAPTAGLAGGALLAGVIVQYAPAPTTVIWALFTAFFVAFAVVAWFLPETVSRRPGAVASLRPRIGVPSPVRPQFLVAVPVLVASWAVGGLYLSLGPSLTAGVLHMRSHLVAGLIIFAFNAAAALTSLVLRNRPPEPVMVAGAVILAAGTGLSLIALGLASTPLFFAGSTVAGAGFGASFLGAFRTLVLLVRPVRRAELIAAMYVVSYLAGSVPAVIAGTLISPLGLLGTAVAYGVVVIALALAVLPASRLLRRASAGAGAGARGGAGGAQPASHT